MSPNLVPFALVNEGLYIVPVIHHNMESALEVRRAIDFFNPSCIAVEVKETWQKEISRAAERLPDISIILDGKQEEKDVSCYLCEPCDPALEALRTGIEKRIPGYCIDLDVGPYPDVVDFLPDPYAIFRLRLKCYYEAYEKQTVHVLPLEKDRVREIHMARRLKELTSSYERVLLVC
ncbi:MAG: hypothetical protein ACM3JI_05250, partial [Anaerolineae bacterium]